MTVLVLDTGSPLVSVAAADERRHALRTCAQRGSSAQLVDMIDGVLGELGMRLEGLTGLLALAGPGSFTGLRVGLATALGLHQATGRPATAVPTLMVMAAASPVAGTVGAAVDALRGEWYAQRYSTRPAGSWPTPLGAAGILPAATLAALTADAWVSWQPAPEPLAGPCSEPPPLALVAARLALAAPPTWSVEALLHPLYLRSPPARPATTVAPSESVAATPAEAH